MEVQIDQIGKKEKEYTFQCTPEMEKEEHLEEWLKIFIQGAEQEITVECEPTTEEETTDSIDLVDLCEEMEALERRVKMQKHLIQQVRLEIYGEKMQQNILQKEIQPAEELDEVIEEMIKLMVKSAREVVNREGQNIRKPAGAAGKKKQQGKGADEQLQEKVWDPGGSHQHGRGSHEQELMFFPAVEYDAGASSTSPRGGTTQHHHALFNYWESGNWRFLKIHFEQMIEN
jgi:hypothetical protein